MQRKCVMCNKHTVWVCGCCTDGPFNLVPLCPEYTKARKGPNKGAKVEHICVSRHRLTPGWYPKGKRSKGTKRKRSSPAPEPPSEDEEDGFCPDCEEGPWV